MRNSTVLAVALACLIATPALADPGHGEAGGVAGLIHPLLGLDHLLAMVSVGLWAGLTGGMARWAWPLAFVAAMLAGFGVAFTGIDLTFAELVVGGSVLAFAVAIALRLRPSILAGTGLIVAFAFFHGFVHAAELPSEATAAQFAGGFALTTAFLHMLGLGFALLLHPRRRGQSSGVGHPSAYRVAEAKEREADQCRP